MCNKIMIENRKKDKIWKSKKFAHKSPSSLRDVLGMDLTAC